MNVRIEQLSIRDAGTVFDWVVRLLRELGEEGDELGELAREHVLEKWRDRKHMYYVLAAKDETGNMVGILTLSVAFAIYANGDYGVIDEMYVTPEYRSARIGALLVDEAIRIGRDHGWTRIDVTAPESERWERTRKFYERMGFAFTGPKLKLLL